jgi:hypothetical protein
LLPAAVAFWLRRRTCAWRSSICLWASRAGEVWVGRSNPHFGHWHEVCVMLRLMVVDMRLDVVVRRLRKTGVQKGFADEV